MDILGVRTVKLEAEDLSLGEVSPKEVVLLSAGGDRDGLRECSVSLIGGGGLLTNPPSRY